MHTPRDATTSASGSLAPTSAEEADYRRRLELAIGADFELQDVIGRGGFGAVYRARDKRLDRPVAVKALRHDLFPSAAILERFDREAKTVARLRHPNILPIHGIGQGNGVGYMIMPLVEGESLQAVIDREGRLPLDEAVRIAAEAANALEAAHKLGIIHRDVKPANIMLDGDERRVLLMDFGIAKGLGTSPGDLTGTGVVIGSPAYMSPEQTRGDKDLDGRSDIYSLGATVYEMLAGRPPIQAANLYELVYKQVTQKVTDISEIAPDVPPGVARAIMRCLHESAEHRWQTAADFRAALLATSERPAASGPDLGMEEESWLSRRGPYVLLLAFLLFFLDFYDNVMMRFALGASEQAYQSWRNSAQLPFIRSSVLILMAAAVLDAVIRIGARAIRGQAPLRIARFALGQPLWWQTWYPRALRVPDSVWDRLPVSAKILRTLVWVQLILVPAGGILVAFVLPTFYSMAREIGKNLPLAISALDLSVRVAAWLLPLTVTMLLIQAHRAGRRHGVPLLKFLAALFDLRGSYWQGSPVRAILKD